VRDRLRLFFLRACACACACAHECRRSRAVLWILSCTHESVNSVLCHVNSVLCHVNSVLCHVNSALCHVAAAVGGAGRPPLTLLPPSFSSCPLHSPPAPLTLLPVTRPLQLWPAHQHASLSLPTGAWSGSTGGILPHIQDHHAGHGVPHLVPWHCTRRCR
jgi:hypothetical protein